MKRKIGLIGIVLSMLFLIACGKEKTLEEKVSLQGFIQGEVKAYREGDDQGFYIQDLPMTKDGDASDYFNYSIGEMLDIDNDGEDELIINGPYGGMYLDCANNKVVVFAEGDGTAGQLSYVYYEDAYWIVVSDTTHSGRLLYSFTQYAGADTIVDSFELKAEYWNQEHYDENSEFTYRGKKITMEEFEKLRKDILGDERE